MERPLKASNFPISYQTAPDQLRLDPKLTHAVVSLHSSHTTTAFQQPASISRSMTIWANIEMIEHHTNALSDSNQKTNHKEAPDQDHLKRFLHDRMEKDRLHASKDGHLIDKTRHVEKSVQELVANGHLPDTKISEHETLFDKIGAHEHKVWTDVCSGKANAPELLEAMGETLLVTTAAGAVAGAAIGTTGFVLVESSAGTATAGTALSSFAFGAMGAAGGSLVSSFEFFGNPKGWWS
jgi:hypothetical protein